jgi:hypothetical protein
MLFTRPTYIVGSGILVLYSVYKLNIKRCFLPLCLYIISFVLLLCFNKAKWGNPLEFQPLQYHEQYRGLRGQMVLKYPKLSFARIPENFLYYFLPTKYNLSSKYPYLKIDGLWYKTCVNDSKYFRLYFDYVEPAFCIPILLPIHFILSILGFATIFRYYRNNKLNYMCIYLIASSIPSIIMMMCMFMALRYRSEFFPIINILTIFGIYEINRNRKKYFVLIPIIVLTVSFYFTVSGLVVEKNMLQTWIDDIPKNWNH